MRAGAAWKLRRLASAIWTRWGLGEIRYLSELDLAVVRVVGKIDDLADRLDPPW